MTVRTNILASNSVIQQYNKGVQKLKQSGRYDNYIRLHLKGVDMKAGMGVDQVNGAHMGAAFLPWHRAMLHAFEADMQQVLEDLSFGLPYWDWSADAVLANPAASLLWTDACMGGTGNPITGPFAQWKTVDQFGRISNAGISRDIGEGSDLPSYAGIAAIIGNVPYDVAPFSTSSKTGFRNALEGFLNPHSAAMHNGVHDWVGGLMGNVNVSPNDPAFFLHHANVDRIWALWQSQNPTQQYAPTDSEGVPTQRYSDVMVGFPVPPTNLAYTPAMVWNIQSLDYSYDQFPPVP